MLLVVPAGGLPWLDVARLRLYLCCGGHPEEAAAEAMAQYPDYLLCGEPFEMCTVSLMVGGSIENCGLSDGCGVSSSSVEVVCTSVKRASRRVTKRQLEGVEDIDRRVRAKLDVVARTARDNGLLGLELLAEGTPALAWPLLEEAVVNGGCCEFEGTLIDTCCRRDVEIPTKVLHELFSGVGRVMSESASPETLAAAKKYELSVAEYLYREYCYRKWDGLVCPDCEEKIYETPRRYAERVTDCVGCAARIHGDCPFDPMDERFEEDKTICPSCDVRYCRPCAKKQLHPYACVRCKCSNKTCSFPWLEECAQCAAHLCGYCHSRERVCDLCIKCVTCSGLKTNECGSCLRRVCQRCDLPEQRDAHHCPDVNCARCVRAPLCKRCLESNYAALAFLPGVTDRASADVLL